MIGWLIRRIIIFGNNLSNATLALASRQLLEFCIDLFLRNGNLPRAARISPYSKSGRRTPICSTGEVKNQVLRDLGENSQSQPGATSESLMSIFITVINFKSVVFLVHCPLQCQYDLLCGPLNLLREDCRSRPSKAFVAFLNSNTSRLDFSMASRLSTNSFLFFGTRALGFQFLLLASENLMFCR